MVSSSVAVPDTPSFFLRGALGGVVVLGVAVSSSAASSAASSTALSETPSTFLLLGALGGVLVLGVAFLLWRRSSQNLTPVAQTAAKKLIVESAADEVDDGPAKKVTVFFGTQTGTAEGFAKALAEEGKARYDNKVNFKLVDLDDYATEDDMYEEKLRKEKIAVLMLATYGDGEPTDNAARFYKWFTETLEAEGAEEKGFWLSELQFAVFGLGNRQYEHFNKVALTVDEKCEKFGGKRLVNCGLGDDDQCIEDDFTAWREQLWPELDMLLRDEDDHLSAAVTYTAAIPEYRVVIHAPGTPVYEESYAVKRNGHSIIDALHPVRSNVAVRKELHTLLSDRSCTHLEFDISQSGLSYETGDHIGVFTQNYQENVEDMARILGYPLDTIFSLHTDDKMGDPLSGGSASLPVPIPGPLTLQTALSRYADLLTPPKKAVLTTLAAFASNPVEEERLKYLASVNGKDDYAHYISSVQRTLLEVISDFPSVKIPLGVFFAAVSARLSPRFYSISSSPKMYPARIHVTCALVQGPSASGKIYRGVCSTWMKHAVPVEAGSTDVSWAPIFVRTSNFRLPTDSKTPVIMIGPGTGMAPFRGFLQERAALIDEGDTVGPAIFFFGCRTRKQDFIYEDELAGFVQKGALTTLNVAFSREGVSKEYVQHKMLQEASIIWNFISGGGYVYVCGDAKSMARDVHRTLNNIIQEQGSMDSTQAEALVKQLQLDGRYQRDIW